MTKTTAAVVLWLLVAMLGCELENPEEAEVDHLLVNIYADAGVENAIIRQHTIFPYHFEQDSTELNKLGRRDLGVLTRRYLEYPGRLNVRQGQAPDDLYAGRLETVMRHLRQAGVAADRMKVGDELAGGDGMTSSEVVLILAISQEETGLWESDSGFDE